MKTCCTGPLISHSIPLFLLLIWRPPGKAQQMGPVFRVNSHTTSFQWAPAVASDSASNFVVDRFRYIQDGDMASAAKNASPQLIESVIVALRRVIWATDLHSRRHLRKFDLTGPQLTLLRELRSRGDLSANALVNVIALSLPKVNGIAARLDTRGLVERRRGTSQRRQMLVGITAAGHELLESALPPLKARFTRGFAALPEWEQTQMVSALQLVVATMEAEELDASPLLAVSEISSLAEAGPGADE